MIIYPDIWNIIDKYANIYKIKDLYELDNIINYYNTIKIKKNNIIYVYVPSTLEYDIVEEYSINLCNKISRISSYYILNLSISNYDDLYKFKVFITEKYSNRYMINNIIELNELLDSCCYLEVYMPSNYVYSIFLYENGDGYNIYKHLYINKEIIEMVKNKNIKVFIPYITSKIIDNQILIGFSN